MTMTNKNLLKATLFLATMILSVAWTTLIAQTPWVVPDDKKEEVCPFKFTPETVKAGAEDLCEELPVMSWNPH